MKSLSILLFSLQILSIHGVSILSEVTKFYQTIIEKGFQEKTINVNSLAKLMNLFDGNPKYNEQGAKHLFSKLGMDENQTVTFDFFHEIVNKIYGDQISDDPYQPQEIHLALTNNPSEMKVMWATMENLENPFVQYQLNTPNMNWEENNKLIKKLTARNFTYTVPQKWWPIFEGVLYEVNMINLSGEKKYSYRVGGFDTANNTMRYSDVFTFTSAPDHNDPNRVTRVYTIADHGTFELLGWETVLKMVKTINESTALQNHKPDFVFAAGDLSYAGLSSEMPLLNISKEDEFELIWDLLHIQNQPVASIVPWMVGNGNHERFYDWQAFTNRYHMPDNSPKLASNGGFWYTFSYGNIQWISLSSEHPLDTSSEQYAFLREALDAAAANRDNVPWIIVTIHKPLYCSVDGSPSFANLLEDILIEYDVDLTITGHMHAYERIHPVKDGVVTVQPTQEFKIMGSKEEKNLSIRKIDKYHSTGFGPVHLMQGHAGGMQFERWVQPQPDWSAFRMANGLIAPNVSFDHSVRGEWNQRFPSQTLDLFNDINCFLPENSQMCELYQQLPLLTQREIDLSFNGYNYSSTYGFGYIQAINSTHLLYEMIPNVDGLLNHDNFYIIKDHKSVNKSK